MSRCEDLLTELNAAPGRFALIDRVAGAEDVLADLEEALGAPRCRVGAALAEAANPPSVEQIERLVGKAALLDDVDVLFAPQLQVNPLALLRRLSRGGPPRIALWPGRLDSGRATFSEPLREDHYDKPVDDVLILRPVPRTFPDEPSFEIQRWMK